MLIELDGACTNSKAFAPSEFNELPDDEFERATARYYMDWPTTPKDHIWVRSCGHLCRRTSTPLLGCCLNTLPTIMSYLVLCTICSASSRSGRVCNVTAQGDI